MATPNTFANARKFLDEKLAKLAQTNESSIVSTSLEIIRYWDVPPKFVDECERFLNRFTSTINPSNAGAANKYTVNDPECGDSDNPRRGLWRAVGVSSKGVNGTMSRVYQTLRIGYATVPSWAEARIVQQDAAQSNAVSVPGVNNTTSAATSYLLLTVLFPNVAPIATMSFVDTLKASPIVFPTGALTGIQGQIITGTFRVLSASQKEESDGSSTVIIRIANTLYTIHTYEDFGIAEQYEQWQIYNVPFELEQSIIDAFVVAYPRSSVLARRNESEKTSELTLRTKSNSPVMFAESLSSSTVLMDEFTVYYFGVTNPDAYVCPTGTPGYGYSRSLRESRGGTYTVIITKSVAKNYEITQQPIGGDFFTQDFLSDRKNAVAANFPQQDGVSRSAGASITELGKVNVEEREKRPIARNVGPNVVHLSDQTKTVVSQAFNADDAADAVAIAGEQSISGNRPNGEGKFDYVIESVTANPDLLGVESSWSFQSEVSWEPSLTQFYIEWSPYHSTEAAALAGDEDAAIYGLGHVLRGMRQFYWKHTISQKYFPTEALAIAYIDDSTAPSSIRSSDGSHHRIVAGLWLAQKRVSIKTVVFEIDV